MRSRGAALSSWGAKEVGNPRYFAKSPVWHGIAIRESLWFQLPQTKILGLRLRNTENKA